MISWLLKQLRPDASDFFKSGTVTPSHVAAIKGHLAVLTAISKNFKQHSNLRDQSGCTPVYFAAQEGFYDCVKYLVEETKADPTVASSDGMTALHAAAQGGHVEVGMPLFIWFYSEWVDVITQNYLIDILIRFCDS